MQLLNTFPADVSFKPAVRQIDHAYLHCCIDDIHLRSFDSHTLVRLDNRRESQQMFKRVREAIEEGATLRECALLEGANSQTMRVARYLMPYYERTRN